MSPMSGLRLAHNPIVVLSFAFCSLWPLEPAQILGEPCEEACSEMEGICGVYDSGAPPWCGGDSEFCCKADTCGCRASIWFVHGQVRIRGAQQGEEADCWQALGLTICRHKVNCAWTMTKPLGGSMCYSSLCNPLAWYCEWTTSVVAPELQDDYILLCDGCGPPDPCLDCELGCPPGTHCEGSCCVDDE